MTTTWASAAWALMASATVMTAGADAPADVVIRGVAVVDARHGVVRAAHDIVVRGTTIAGIAPAGGRLPPAKTLIDGRGKFAMPGLIDVQTTLAVFSRATAAAVLADGVTAVRDVGTGAAQIAEWRRALAYGQMYAPRIARACAELSTPTAPNAVRVVEPGCGDAGNGAGRALTALLRARRLPAVGAASARGAGIASGAAPASLHDALGQLVTAGFTPAEALRAATVEAAAWLALTDLGELAVGYGADSVVTTANPLRDIANARAIDAVVFRGEALTQAHLNRLRAGHMPKTDAAIPR